MPEPLGYHHGRSDLERVGLFAEMEYMHGQPYTAPLTHSGVRDLKKSQMYPGVPKWKTGLQDCYFDQKFKRIFEKEAYTSPYVMEVEAKKEFKKKYPNLRTFIPPSYSKKHATPGDYFGTFGGIVKAFSPVSKPRTKEAKLPLNFKVNPGKKGNAGYTDICINKYPSYKPSPYDDPRPIRGKGGKLIPFLSGNPGGYFYKNPYYTDKIQTTYKEDFEKTKLKSGQFYPSGKNKTLDGCFSKYPPYQSSPESPPKMGKAKGQPETRAGVFRPPPGNKTMYTKSIMGNKVDIALNAQNWRNFKPITYTREFLV
ncbi:UPF0602 protein C4orf47 homolog [Macrosteles quadrilineatus]|uniref:UPF0602 protein C4orf47 homolog n=1 Tax=Macrosteles quadrilineatus TaxID=74068 RepID=UPI0023E2C620|nr:UPF0602 protein C4orf47 homolog [Macrosteles quadrilineatus]